MSERIPFRLRGQHMSRVDGFSDVVFGFALTLIVVSLEVPRNFGDLIESLKGAPAFLLCFLLLIQIWYVHYRYFRRYGLEDGPNIALNSALLFVVLLFAYPLKFLFTLLTGRAHEGAITTDRVGPLMVIYGLGYAAVWLIFAAMHWRAFRHPSLDLNEVERIDTRRSLAICLGQAGIGLLSALIALLLPARVAGAAGYPYFAVGFSNWWCGTHFGRLRRQTEDRILAARSAASV